MIYIPSFRTIGKGVEGILRFCLNNSKRCNAGITGGKDIRSTPLKWAQVV
jgi:hypothetical protein